MAEFVQQAMEQMVPELEQLQRTELLSPDEVKELVKRRKKFEYSIQKQTKRKEDFLGYIQYEMALLSLINIRREKLGYIHKKDEIDYAVARRINKLYKIMERRFPDDVQIWTSHVEFLCRMKWHEYVGKTYRRMLQHHLYNSSLWVATAKYEWEELKNAENARKTLLEGLRINEKSENLYREYFRFELSYVEHLRNRMELMGVKDMEIDHETHDDVMKGQIVKAVFTQIAQVVPKPEFLCSLIEIYNEFEDVVNSQEDETVSALIENTLVTNFSNSPIVWDTLARNTLRNTKQTVSTLKKLECCAQFYEQGLESVKDNRDAAMQMLDMFLQTLIEMTRLVPKDLSWWVSNNTLKCLKLGRDNDILSEEALQLWREIGKTCKVVREDPNFPKEEESSSEEEKNG